MFHLLRSCHIPHPSDDIYDLIDGTMSRAAARVKARSFDQQRPTLYVLGNQKLWAKARENAACAEEKYMLTHLKKTGERPLTRFGSAARISLCHECVFLNT